ncbi:hypothetical protein BOX15_Mlig024654g1 [Macrostomum lignano]|uniref:Uncharacterized protein n=1 Tax=Macrostomum lignano TaxID=282301 RepID=A0A267FHC4_9PLAT|nr:hypothetical protein BOX15_Mlig024654g1 [Macrostomum lignano]
MKLLPVWSAAVLMLLIDISAVPPSRAQQPSFEPIDFADSEHGIEELVEQKLLQGEPGVEKRRHSFLGKRRHSFLGKRRHSFLGKRRHSFLGKRRHSFMGKRRHSFMGKRRHSFLGKRRHSFLGKRRHGFIGKRGQHTGDSVADFDDDY